MAKFDSTNPRKHYTNLELVPGPLVTKKRIKEQYQKMAFKWHPDRNQSEDAKQKFSDISESYSLLINIESKREYDRWLTQTEGHQAAGSSNNQRMVWTKSRASSSSSNRAFDERMVDNRATEFGDIRRKTTASRPRSYYNNNYYSGSSKDTSSSTRSSTRSDYRTAIHSMEADARRENKYGNEKVRAHQNFVQEDRLKFAFTAIIVLGAALFGSHFTR